MKFGFNTSLEAIIKTKPKKSIYSCKWYITHYSQQLKQQEEFHVVLRFRLCMLKCISSLEECDKNSLLGDSLDLYRSTAL